MKSGDLTSLDRARLQKVVYDAWFVSPERKNLYACNTSASLTTLRQRSSVADQLGNGQLPRPDDPSGNTTIIKGDGVRTAGPPIDRTRTRTPVPERPT